jgi:hypothetical protein
MDFGAHDVFSSSDVPKMVDQQNSWNSLVISNYLLYDRQQLSAPMADFLVMRLPGWTSDQFCARVELVAGDVVGRYTRGEHEVCVEALPNHGRVNRGFEHVGVPYGHRLDPALRQVKKLPRNGNTTPVLHPYPSAQRCLGSEPH